MRYKQINPSNEFYLTPSQIDYGQIVVSITGDLCIKINDPSYRKPDIEGQLYHYEQDLMLDLVTGKKGWANAASKFKDIPLHEVTFLTNNESKMEK